MGSLNKDVFAGDVLRNEYRRQMDEHARLASEAERCRHELERIEAYQQTAADRATSIMETPENKQVWSELARAAIASIPPADQVADMVERVARALCYEDGPQGCGCNGECKSDPFPPDDIFMRYARAAIAALQAVPAANGEAGEGLGDCELCGKPLALGQFVNVYDDIGTAHANCERPFAKPSEPTAAPGDDGSTMPTFVLLGEPALLETVEERLLTATEEAELVERINANPYLQPLPEQPALKASGEE